MNTSYNFRIKRWDKIIKAHCVSFICTLLVTLVLTGAAYGQQEITVTGQVTDENNDPLPGATIAIEGTDQGTSTDMDGMYMIDVAEDAVLVFSFVGYESQRIAVGGRNEINVRLEIVTGSLEEMVVVGYGEESRRRLTTSVSKVSGELVENIPVSDLSEGLKGKISGTRIYNRSGMPGEEPIIEIRGGSSINRSNAPLILVDGIERPLSDINSKDIQDVTVLKDAASTSIYGSRASNGVILVTTKRGGWNETPIFTYGFNNGFQERAQSYDLMNAEEYVRFSRENVHPNHPNYENYINRNGFSASGGNNENSIYSTRYLQPGENVPEGWKSIQDPIDPSRTLIFTDTDFEDVMFSRAFWQNHDLSVSGGTGGIRYRASLGYADDEGIALQSGWERISARANTDIRINEDITFSGDLDYTESDTELFGNQVITIYRGAYATPPTQKPRHEDGTPTRGFNAASPNPLFFDYINVNDNVETNFSVGGKLNWGINNKLNLTIDGRRYRYFQERSEFERANFFSSERSARFRTWRRNRTHFDAHIRYSDNVGEHSFSLMSGLSYMDTSFLTSDVEAFGASTDKIRTLNASSEISNASTNITEEVLIGSFGRINYDYDEKYLLSASFRADGSSRFAEDNRWGFFPGFSFAWIISEESFLEENRTISLLKLRSSLGFTGNNSVGLFDAFGIYRADQFYGGNAGIRPSQMPNQDLRWESTRQLDIGLDVGLINDRIVIAADYFDKLTDDLLFTVPLPNTTGYNNIIQNVGQVRFNGFDLEITTRNIETGNFSWSSSLSLGYVQNKVEKLPDNGRDRNRIGGFVDANGDEFGGIAEGEPLARIYGHKASHIIETQEQLDNACFDELSPGWSPEDGSRQTGRKKIGDIEWLDRDGNCRITTNDRFNLGNELPHTTGGLTNSFRYKNWSLDIAVDWAIGHTIVDMAYNMNFLGSFQNNYQMSRELLSSWQEPGDDTKWPKWQPINFQLDSNYMPQRTNSLFAYKADYLAIREIKFGHDLSENIVNRFGLKGLNLYASIYNLHYFTNVKGISPERGSTDTRRQDSANNGFPMVRKVIFGLQLSF